MEKLSKNSKDSVFFAENVSFSRAKLSAALCAYATGENTSQQVIVEKFLQTTEGLPFKSQAEKCAFLYSLSMWIGDTRFVFPTAKLMEYLLPLHRKWSDSKDLLADRVQVKSVSSSADSKTIANFLRIRTGFLYTYFKSSLNKFVRTIPKKESSWIFMSQYLLGKSKEGTKFAITHQDFALLTEFGGLDLFSKEDLDSLLESFVKTDLSKIRFLNEFMRLAQDEDESFFSSACRFVFSYNDLYYTTARDYYNYLSTDAISVYVAKYEGAYSYSELEERLDLFDFWFRYRDNLFEQRVKYVPVFYLENFRRVPTYLLSHLAEGKNIRTCGNFAQIMSKKMAHILCSLPIDTVWDNHLVIAYFESIGTDPYLISRLTAYARSTYDGLENMTSKLEFWKNATLLLSAEIEEFKALNNETEQILLAFLDHCERDGQDFSLKGRTLASLLRLATAWMEDIRLKKITANFKYWRGANYQEWNLLENGVWYAIFQLTNSGALQEEGAYMGHCVGGYSYSCETGRCSIWSLRVKEGKAWKRLATMEILANGEIVQAKAKYNQSPSNTYLNMIKSWASEQKLRFVRV